MEINVTPKIAHLQKFLNEFGPAKFKWLSSGLEIRGIVDLPRAMLEAKSLIDRFQLNLTITHTADMLSYRGFEVNYVETK